MTQQNQAGNGPNMAAAARVSRKIIERRNGYNEEIHSAEIGVHSPHLLEFGDVLRTPRQVEHIQQLAYQEGMREGLKEGDTHLAHETSALRDKINAVYAERNELAIALARLTLVRQIELKQGKGNWAGYGFDPNNGRAVVYVQLPSGHQISWHMNDEITEKFSNPDAEKPLPVFEGEWDGTFIGREENWAVRHVYSPRDAYAYDESPAEPEIHHPEGATHYRICTAGKRRYYHQDPVTGWHFYHADSGIWYPTDLSADYLESHIQRLDCDTQDQTITALGNSIVMQGKADATAVQALATRVAALETQTAALSAVCHTQPQASIQYLASLIAEYPLRKKDAAE